MTLRQVFQARAQERNLLNYLIRAKLHQSRACRSAAERASQYTWKCASASLAPSVVFSVVVCGKGVETQSVECTDDVISF